MRRRLAIIIGAVSIIAAVAITTTLVVRSPGVPRVSTLGTIAPRTTTAATVTTHTSRSSPPAPSATYPTATTVPVARPPATIGIPAIGVDASVVPVGLVPGTDTLQIPDIDQVGWYRLGPSPGQTGSAVLVAHIDGDGRPGVFWRLGQLTPGDRITITFRDTRSRTFRVTGRQQVPKTELPAELFSRAGPPRIALITCGGAFDTRTRHYRDNVVVVATPG
jgi:sortase (surface protein transpeptidase)